VYSRNWTAAAVADFAARRCLNTTIFGPRIPGSAAVLVIGQRGNSIYAAAFYRSRQRAHAQFQRVFYSLLSTVTGATQIRRSLLPL